MRKAVAVAAVVLVALAVLLILQTTEPRGVLNYALALGVSAAGVEPVGDRRRSGRPPTTTPAS